MAERLPPGKAAAICGLSRATLVKLARAGKIPGAAPLDDEQKLWRFDERELRAWLRRREAACAAKETFTGGTGSPGRGSRFAGAKLDAAYERALSGKPESA